MSATEYGVNAPEVVKLWSKALYRESIKESFIGRFIGDGPSALIQRKNDLKKSAGDRIRLTLRMKLTGAGVQGDDTLEGNEESLSTYTDDILINQLRHAVRVKGKMTEQRVPWSIREESKDGLKDWWTERHEVAFMNQIAGNVAQTDTKYTGNQAALAATSILRGGDATTDQGIDSSDLFTLTLIDRAVTTAKLASPGFRPLKIGGKSKYVCFLHPYQVEQMRTSTTTGQWLDIQKAAMQGGDVSNNPIYSGALGEYNGVILHESQYLPKGVHSTALTAVDNTRRAVFCGAQAAAIAFGGDSNGVNDPAWQEELFDYGNQLGVKAGFIYGLKKTQFNSADFSSLVISTYTAG
ncbi:N4-gp56 family major capsid protein [Methylocaldum sp.]|uniref:N4-gp56 family major capsid protein n=1 Tax=Methylocaldum sp. TaxID=1969727 RepID=UPI002D616592|nr:N4-gp56 family major capsid protein [Methylocaldum sp.]HYE38220.1 N4-gp56 family major capsid protein [Methylocaldum sp.]